MFEAIPFNVRCTIKGDDKMIVTIDIIKNSFSFNSFLDADRRIVNNKIERIKTMNDNPWV